MTQYLVNVSAFLVMDSPSAVAAIEKAEAALAAAGLTVRAASIACEGNYIHDYIFLLTPFRVASYYRDMKNSTKTLIGIQDEYVETVNAGIARWSHARKQYAGDLGGHANRIAHGAHRVAAERLTKLGFSKEQIRIVLKDAWEMASLIRHAEGCNE